MIDKIKTWSVMLVLCGVVGAFGFLKGMGYEQMKRQASQTNAVQYIVTKNVELQKVADDTSVKVQRSNDKTEVVYKTIIQKEIEYVQNNPNSGDVVDADFVRLYNAASLACDLAEPSCYSASEPTGNITLADIIRQHRETGKLYQTCKIANDGWEDFYAGVRKKNNPEQGELNESN